MKEIYLTPHQKLLSPVVLSNELGLVKPSEELVYNHRIGYVLIGSLITVTALYIIISWHNYHQERKVNN